MKKLMSVILSALLLFSCITCAFMAPASATGNLWTDLTADDWYTRQVHSPVEDVLTLEEKKMSDVYPDDFLYTPSDDSYSLNKAAHGKHFYIKLPATEKNTDYKLSFDYSVTPKGEDTTPLMYKVLLINKSAMGNSLCWNKYGEFYADRSWLGVQNIVIPSDNKTLSGEDANGTLTYSFNTGKYEDYYIFIMFNQIETFTLSGFGLFDGNYVEEEDPAELWGELTSDDWYTRQVHSPVEDVLTLEEKKMSDVYPEDFVYSSANDSYSLKKGAHGKHFYIKLPATAKNKDYKLSFDYSVTPKGEDTTPLMYKVLLINKSAMGNSLCWNKYGEFYADRSWLGVQNIVIPSNNKTLSGEDANGTLTYSFNTGKYEDYYVFIMFNQIESFTLSNLSLIDPALVEEDDDDQSTVVNNWQSTSTAITFPIEEDAEKGDVIAPSNADGVNFYHNIEGLEPNTDYLLTFDYKADPGSKNGTFRKTKLCTPSGFMDPVCWSGGEALSGEMFNNRAWLGVTDIHTDLAVDNTWTTYAYEFNSGANTEFYFYLRTDKLADLLLTPVSVIKKPVFTPKSKDYNLGSVSCSEEAPAAGTTVTVTATPLKGNGFTGWYNSNDELISTERTISVTVPADYSAPTAVFSAGEIKVENASMEDSTIGLLAYFDKTDGFNKKIIDDNYDVEYYKTPAWEMNLQAHAGQVRTGNKAIKVQTQYSYSGRHFEGLEKNTDYAVSFWTYMQEGTGLTLNAMVMGKGEKPYYEVSANNFSENYKGALGVANTSASATSTWQEVVVPFNSGDNTEITLWFILRGANSDRCWIDDFAVYRPVNLEVAADLGGSASATEQGSIAKGSTVTVTATPSKGNSFKHWLDKNGNVVSTETEYTLTVNEDTYLKAIFGGYNKPAREYFALNGQDGSFEKGSILGFYADDETYGTSVGFCAWKVTDALAYEGSRSLEVTSYYRDTVLPINGLNKNTDYRLSFYVKYPYPGPQTDWNHINAFKICGIEDKHSTNAENIYAEATSYIAGDSGWNRVELYFNTGDATAVNFFIRYGGEPNLAPKLYVDNLYLYEYYSANELKNGQMTDDIAPWLGNGEIENNTLKLSGKDTTAYQLLALDEFSNYTVTFRAKGDFFASASNVTSTIPSVFNAISSVSYVDGKSDDFKQYSFDLYSGVHKGIALMFASNDGDAYIDDVTITKQLSAVGAVIENVDFETDRFALTHSDKEVYEIYTATSANDEKVHSGNKSLHFKYNTAKAELETILDEVFLSHFVKENYNYKLTLYYKLAGESTINIEPSYPATYYTGGFADYSGEVGREHSTVGGWQRLDFIFTANASGIIKTAIYNIIGKTKCDFYVDDIRLAVAADLVIDPDTEKQYCSDFYNVIANGSFEEKMADGHWPGLPTASKVITDKGGADSGDHFLRITKGTRYILPLKLNPSEIYYFGATARVSKGGKGSIALTTMVDPIAVYYMDINDKVASLDEFTSTEWKRAAYGFRAAPTGTSYLVIECTEGYMDIDTVSLCLEKFTFEENPNRYYEIVRFDYDNIPEDMIVLNGGLDSEGNLIGDGFNIIEGDSVDGGSPETGESAAFMLIMATAIISAALLFVLKRKRGEDNA